LKLKLKEGGKGGKGSDVINKYKYKYKYKYGKGVYGGKDL